MKFLNIIWIIVLGITSTQVWAYGSSSSAKSCIKPQFSDFIPVEKAEVSPQSSFSFKASATTNPKSIEVTIKQQPIKVTITPNAQGYQISGTLPVDLKGTIARINIDAETQGQCKGGGGWLIKIKE